MGPHNGARRKEDCDFIETPFYKWSQHTGGRNKAQGRYHKWRQGSVISAHRANFTSKTQTREECGLTATGSREAHRKKGDPRDQEERNR